MGVVSVVYNLHQGRDPLDYIMVSQEDKAKVRNIKVISNAECVPKHKLLEFYTPPGSRQVMVTDTRFKLKLTLDPLISMFVHSF